MSAHGPHIFDYLDPVLYLNDYFEYRKEKNPRFSQRMFAQKVGIKSTGFICDVLKGRRQLTNTQVENFLKGMDLKGAEEEFFRGMVKYSQATSRQSRNEWRKHLESLQPSPMKRLNKVVAKYYSKWYHIAVRESLALGRYSGEFEEFADEIAQSVFPKIKRSEALGALEFLHKNGFIIQDSSILEDGSQSETPVWVAKHKSLTAGSQELGKTYLRDFQSDMMDLAKDALDQVNPQKRNISCTTMSISGDAMNQIRERISDFHTEIVQLVQNDAHEDRLYHMNIQFFPLGGKFEDETDD